MQTTFRITTGSRRLNIVVMIIVPHPWIVIELSQQNAALTSQLQSQRAELEIAQKRNVTLAWAAIGIALAALIISVI